jgi:hypothetical protein
LEINKEGHSCLLSGGTPDSHYRRFGADLLPFLAQTTVAPRRRLAHRTVRCLLPTVGAGHVSPADFAADRCAVDRWLTGQSSAPPDSPVNFSRTPLNFSREQRLRRGRLTGQSSAPPDSPVNYSRTPSSSPESGWFTSDSSGAPDTVRCSTRHCLVHPDRAAVGCTQPTLFQSIFSCF